MRNVNAPLTSELGVVAVDVVEGQVVEDVAKERSPVGELAAETFGLAEFQ
jgi:hypothetical protein